MMQLMIDRFNIQYATIRLVIMTGVAHQSPINLPLNYSKPPTATDLMKPIVSTATAQPQTTTLSWTTSLEK